MSAPTTTPTTAQAAAIASQNPHARSDIAPARDSWRTTLFNRLFNWACDYPQREWWMFVLRCIRPILRVGSSVIVLRDQDVREVLAHNTEFPVPWAQYMQQVTGNRNFVLGMADGPTYRLNYAQLTAAFKRDDVPRHVAPLAAKASASILKDQQRIDAIRDLAWEVPARLCEEYFGIAVPDKSQLAEWSMQMSGFIFGPPCAPPATAKTQAAMAAANAFRSLIRGAIQATRNGAGIGIVLPRLIQMQLQNPQQLPDPVIEAHLFGMVTGFIPTNVLAGGHILDTLLRRKKFMARARAAALADDDELLWRCLQETLRFRHINLGAFRTTWENGYTLAAGTPHETFIAPGTPILASTQSAMFDRRRVAHPWRFDPGRPAEDYLVFGYGQHWCLGKYIAIAQLTQTFKALLRNEGLRRARGKAGKMQRISAFPASMTVEWDS